MIVLILLTGTLVIGSAPAYACDCVTSDVPERVGYSDLVITGKVTAFKRTSATQPVWYTFRVDHAYKGRPKVTLKVSTWGDEAGCGVKFSRGARYLVFAHKFQGRLGTNLCDGNMKVAQGKGPITAEDLPKWADPKTIKQLGKPRKVR
ncbi:hypothetical protein [Herbidospora cretacea]|uniref:hypothetical protein n=1 Tax=Herbidospora cretacea TaxID=28444 RepID=UPI000773D499|nr:hypothetical protein [Herbidospora cretacea]